MDEITHPTKKSTSRPKLVDRYDDIFTLREQPMPVSIIERVMEEALEDLIKGQKILKASAYFRKKGISIKTIERYADKHEKIGHMYAEFKAGIGDNREIGGLDKSLNPQMVMFTQPLYDPAWKELYKYHASLKTDTPSVTGLRIIEVPVMPTTERVPPKQNPEEVAATIHKQTQRDDGWRNK